MKPPSKRPIKPVHPGSLTIQDAWASLRQHTPARIAMGRTGVSLPTREVLAFSQAHALARDAVHLPLDTNALLQDLQAIALPVCLVHSAAPDRTAYLARPDWGRRLAPQTVLPEANQPCDLAIILADGLSATAVHRQALPLLQALLPLLGSLHLGPLVVAQQARVALADEIGQRLAAKMTVILIGERPGLSAPDSLGAYITYGPKVGNTDAQRNCVSNIRPQGLGFEEAARQIADIVHHGLTAGKTGVWAG